MLDLPILNVHLNACSEDWQQMTPVEQGRHCAHCNRTVLDFTTRTQVDLEAAFQTSSDGRVCGRFRQSQLAPKPQLRPKLRRFLVALVLVCGLGLASGEARAQVRQAARTANCASSTELALKTPQELNPVALAELDKSLLAPIGDVPVREQLAFGMVNEIMPAYKNGELTQFITKNAKWPTSSKPIDAEGKVFIGFIVDKTGRVRDAKVLKGIHPALDAEALRVVRLLDKQFTPGQQHNLPVDVRYTLPITFERK